MVNTRLPRGVCGRTTHPIGASFAYWRDTPKITNFSHQAGGWSWPDWWWLIICYPRGAPVTVAIDDTLFRCKLPT